MGCRNNVPYLQHADAAAAAAPAASDSHLTADHALLQLVILLEAGTVTSTLTSTFTVTFTLSLNCG